MQRENNRLLSKALSRRDVVKGLAGLALTTGIVGCSYSGSSAKTLVHSTSGTPSQGTRGKLIMKKAGDQPAWSPDSKHIASINSDRNVQIWEALSGKTLVMYNGHPAGTTFVGWAPDGKRVVSTGAYDGTDTPLIQIWNPDIGRLLKTYTRSDNNRWVDNNIATIGWSPDGKYIASGRVDVQIWSPDTGDEAYEYIINDPTFSAMHLRWSPDSKRIAMTTMYEEGINDNTVASWGALTGNNLLTYKVKEALHLDWSPDGSKIVTASASGLDIWDTSIGKNLYSEASQQLIREVAWSPNGKLIASGGDDNQVRLWEPLTGHTVYTYKGHSGGTNSTIDSIAWSPDSTMIASVGGDNVVQIWMAK